MNALKNALAVVPWVLMMAACESASDQTASYQTASYQTAAMQASEGGDQKAAVSLAKKEVARFTAPDQCSRTNSVNCGTLALAWGTLANYQILDGDSTAGEGSFSSAKGALGWTDPAIRSSATAMVYRDVSEAYWKTGDRARAVAVFNEGRAAGGDMWMYMSSAARAADEPPARQAPDPGPPPSRGGAVIAGTALSP
ncbi:MAG: hypothetical protein PSV46_14860 [Reyranella sp.]|nr:hypothetical protein [Reyranella sp.]